MFARAKYPTKAKLTTAVSMSDMVSADEDVMFTLINWPGKIETTTAINKSFIVFTNFL